MQLQTIPRAYVTVALRTARLPLDAVARVANHEGESWPPALAFDSFEAHVKQLVGSLFNDEDLVRQGRLGQTRVTKLRDAIELRTEAEQTTSEADESFRARRQADEEKRRAATTRAKQREAEAKREQRRAEAAVDAKARQREEQARQTEQERKAALAKKARAAKAASISAERSAISKAKVANTAKAAALATDKKIRATKAVRKSA